MAAVPKDPTDTKDIGYKGACLAFPDEGIDSLRMRVDPTCMLYYWLGMDVWEGTRETPWGWVHQTISLHELYESGFGWEFG